MSETCLQVVQDNERFITYCALPCGHEGDHDDAAHYRTSPEMSEPKGNVDLIEEIAHLVWKQGHYSTPWEGWYYKARWWDVAREILAIVEAHRNNGLEPVDWMTSANITSHKALRDLQCAKVADVQYGRELRCTLEAGHRGACAL